MEVGLHFTITLPDDQVALLVGRPDDDSTGWYDEASRAAGVWVRDNTALALDSMVSECVVEVDGEFVDDAVVVEAVVVEAVAD